MKITKTLLLLSAFLTVAAHADDAVFDRSDEVKKYLRIIETGTMAQITETCKTIYSSGISDKTLATSVGKKLLESHKTLNPKDKLRAQYVAWLTKALGSFGDPSTVPILNEIKSSGSSRSIKNHAAKQLQLIDWHRSKNEIMASTQYHTPDADPKASRYLNLIMSDDFSYKQYAAEKTSWEKIFDDRIFDAMNQQLLQFHNEPAGKESKMQVQALSWYAKMLGYSGNRKYRDTLQKIVNSKAHSKIRKYAKVGLKMLS